MNIQEHYSTLCINETATDDEITFAYKKLAHQLHPDKNIDRIEWANEKMKRLNLAYDAVIAHRFQYSESSSKGAPSQLQKEKKQSTTSQSIHIKDDKKYNEALTNHFIKLRESAKDSLYQYFQYNLYNILNREKPYNQSQFNNIVLRLRKTYHGIKQLRSHTKNRDLLNHFDVFNTTIFNFYRSSECLNILDSYADLTDVEAYRLYKQGDEILHTAHKEIFYNRHNRGYFKKDEAYSSVLKAIMIFKKTIQLFPRSSWVVETELKRDYSQSLKDYLELFFTE